MTDNDDARVILLNIRRMALELYPFPEGCRVDPVYAMAFGLIAGLCTEAIQAVNQNRKASFVIETGREGHQTPCLSALASGEACQPDELLMRCAICGFIVDTKFAAEKPTVRMRP